MSESSSPDFVQQPNPVVPTEPSAEEMRRQYLNHEASVRSIGTLYFIGAFILVLMGVIHVIFNIEVPLAVRVPFATFLIGLGIFQFFVARGLRALKSWSRIPVGVLSGIGLLTFPLGTLIHGYILYLVFCKKGFRVFSPQYKQVIAATPHIRYKTHIIVWILFGIIVVAMMLGLFAVLLSPK